MSATLLRQIERGGGVHVRGFPWLADDEWRKLPVSALTSNILCRQHNSDLSALDAIGEKFVDHLERVDAEFTALDERPWIWAVNGHAFERWLLKTLCGLILSKSARTISGERLTPEIPSGWIDILYGVQSFPPTWGLYVAGEVGRSTPVTPGTYAFAPVTRGRGGEIGGIHAVLAGREFTLMATDVPERRAGAIGPSSVYRPRFMSFEHGSVRKIVYFHWDQRGVEHAGVNLTWAPSRP